MKKHNLFKVLGIFLLLIIVASYFLGDRNGTISYIGLLDTGISFYQTMYYFFYLLIFLLAVGGLYGVLSKSNSYKKLLDVISSKLKPIGRKAVFLIIILMSVIVSFTGLTLPVIIFIPFVSAIVIKLGYDKLVAMATTIGSVVIGILGGVFVTFVDPSSYSLVTFESFVGLEGQFDNMFPKLLLLFSGITILILFVNSYIEGVEKKKVKYDLSDNSSVLVDEVSGDYSDIKVWPIALSLILLLVVIVLGLFPFSDLFQDTFFTSFHSVISGITVGNLIARLIFMIAVFGIYQLVVFIISKIKKVKFVFKRKLAIWIGIILLLVFDVLNGAEVFNLYEFSFIESLSDLFSGSDFLDFNIVTESIFSNITAFGQWFSNGDSLAYLLISVVLFIFTIVIALLDKIKFDDYVDSSLNGIKKYVPVVGLTMMAYTVLVISYTNGFLEAIISSYGKFNFGISSLLALLGSFLNVDIYYIAVGVFSPMLELITDESIYPSVAMIFQGIYAIFNMLAPTSIILIFALTYFDIPYTTWIKFIWRFILSVIILLAFVTMLVALL